MDDTSTTTTRAPHAPEVMISYSSRDRSRVTQIVQALRQSGVSLWIDHVGIDGAQRWSEEIVNAIEACRVVMLFISRASMESANIPKEVALAWESGKEFLPVVLEEAKVPKSMAYQLAGIQYLRLDDGDPTAKFDAVLRALVRKGVHVSPYTMAVVSAGVGERDQALEWLSQACNERSMSLSQLKSEPRFNAMRAHPRFIELARRAETIVLDQEDKSEEIVLAQPLIARPAPRPLAPAGPVPWWKRLLWPDITDDRSAREAAALGVWASAAIIASSWIFSFLVPTSMMTAASWWNDPIILTAIFLAIGFGVQKMGRPAAIIGAALCAVGMLGNLSALSGLRMLMQTQENYARMSGQQQIPDQPDYGGLYHAALFGVIAGIAFVVAFVNAVRGTLSYRQMVAARQAVDKQNALSPENLMAVRRKVMAAVRRIWGSGSLAPATSGQTTGSAPATPRSPASQVTAATREPLAAQPSAFSEAIAVGETRPLYAPLPSEPAPALVNAAREDFAPSAAVPVPAAADAVDQFPEFDDAPDVHTLGDLIGSNPFRLSRASAFLLSNVAAALVYILARAIMLPAPIHPVYWQFAFLESLAFTLATLVAFRLVHTGWTAALVAAFGTVALVLPVYHFTLGTFDIRDVFYREQFQEFLLLPFAFSLATLLGLFFLIPRIRPLVLGIWVGAVCAEVATSMLITTLRDLGSVPPPDPVLNGVMAFFVGVRSLVFAAVFWAGLKLTGIGRTAR